MQQTRGAAAWHSFVRSNWITAVWNWLLGLVGKAAEAVLAVTILYSTVQVFTTTNPSVDLGMFLAQQAALDVGGLGLIKLANQAKRDGLTEQAAKARKVSIILMVLMVIGVVVANIESKITTTQTTLDAHHHLMTTVLGFQQAYPIVAIVIEVLLLIARGTMAVVYGFTIHDLESSMPEQAHQSGQQDIQALLSWSMVGMAAHLQASFEQQLQELASAQKTALTHLAFQQSQRVNQVDVQMQRLVSDVQTLQEIPECVAPEIDYQHLAVALGPLFEQRMHASVSAIKTTIIEEVRATLPMAPEPPQIEAGARSQSQKVSGSGASQKREKTAPEPVLVRGNKEPEERLEAAYRLLLENSIRVSGRVLAKEAHVNRGFASEWLSKQPEPVQKVAPEPQHVVDSEPVE